MGYDDDDEENDVNDLEQKLNDFQNRFCENVYKEISIGGNVGADDIEESIKYFSIKEEYEKCVKLKNALKKALKNKKNV